LYLKYKKQGEWLHYDVASKLKTQESYKDNKLEGIQKRYAENGSLLNIINYKNDTISGLCEGYQNGILDYTYHYENGEKNGPYETYYSDGKLKSEGFYTDGEFGGYSYNYYKDGTISSREKYSDDTLVEYISFNIEGKINTTIDYTSKTGPSKDSFNNGMLIRNANYINGVLNGKFDYKNKLGQPISQGEYVNGKLHNSYTYYGHIGEPLNKSNYYCGKVNGPYEYYDQLGSLRIKGNYVMDYEDGLSTSYYHNKSKMVETNYKLDLKYGEKNYYNQQGIKILVIGFQNDLPVYYKPLDSKNECSEQIAIADYTGKITSKYSNGQAAIQLEYLNGNIENLFTIYAQNGTKQYESNNKTGLFEGTRTEYYENGNVYKLERFEKNNYQGLTEYFAADGKPILKISYVDDELHGKTTVYKDGKIVLTKTYNSDELVEISK
jgi:uncharacterized protein